ncbi:MAG: hypothetical protein DWQ37_15475 [Planctomycetota bacterium]|nr:MAG: hypothetical protein DWQ37_15475 [Planctomycetota bacterium]
MVPRRWSICVAVLGLASLAICAGCGPGSSADDGTRRVILLINGPDPFWDAMLAGMKDAEKEFDLKGSKLRVEREMNDGTPKGQIDKMRQFANQSDIAAVAVSVTDSNNRAIADAMKACREAGIKVIAIDSDVDREQSRDARFAYLGTNNVVGGQELGKAAAGIRPEGGKYATFVGIKAAANARERISGFAEGAGDKFEQVENLGDDMDRSIAKKNVKDALDRHPDLDVLVGIWAYNAHAIVEVVDERGLGDETSVVVFDAAPLAIDDVAEGKIDAMVVQNPYEMGYLGTRLMQALVDDDHETIHEMFPDYDPQTHEFSEEDGDVYITGLRVVHPDEGTPLSADMFDEQTEFLSLSEFKKWLAEHNLTGS